MNVLMQRPAGATQSSPAAGPDVAVVYTSPEPTRAAMHKAALLAAGLDTRIRLLVPQIVPYPLPIDHPAPNGAFAEQQLHSLLPDSVDVQIEIRLCRDFESGVLPAVGTDSVVVIPTPRRWWPSWENRLARRLEQQGSEVLRVAC